MAYKKLKYWFDKELAELLADKIVVVEPSFLKKEFVRSLADRLEPLELKDRVELFADELHLRFDGSFQNGLEVLLRITGPENPRETGMFTGYYWLMPVAKYIEKYGLSDFAASMKGIEEITKRNTGEYAIRPFLVHHFEPCMKQMEKWSTSSNKHVRRLSSEGLRPRLPWAKKLDAFIRDPGPIFPVLENLKDDPSKYVQKSVANCLNDILKDNPETARTLLKRWNTADAGPERKWIIRHALRNLIKAGNPWAIEMTR